MTGARTRWRDMPDSAVDRAARDVLAVLARIDLRQPRNPDPVDPYDATASGRQTSSEEDS